MEYFDLFELPISLRVHKDEVLKKYYALCKTYHPDRFGLNSIEEREKALQMTSRINLAKQVLDDPYKRLEYILKEKEVIQAEEKYELPAAFLMEMMELNESWMEEDAEGDKKEGIQNEIRSFEEGLEQDVSEYFKAERLELTVEAGQKLRAYYYKRKYLDRLKEQMKGYTLPGHL